MTLRGRRVARTRRASEALFTAETLHRNVQPRFRQDEAPAMAAPSVSSRSADSGRDREGWGGNAGKRWIFEVTAMSRLLAGSVTLKFDSHALPPRLPFRKRPSVLPEGWRSDDHWVRREA